MPQSGSPKVTSADGTYNRADPRLPSREDISRTQAKTLKAGGPSKADLTVVDLGAGLVVIKDFHVKARWVRLTGRLQISRECKAYRCLAGLPGVGGFIGRIDRHALALEWIEGRQLFYVMEDCGDTEAVWNELREIVEAMHGQGLAHLDLRGRGNVILTADGHIRIVDFASAICLRPGGLRHRLFFRRLAAADRAALLKWKRQLGAGEYTDKEMEFLRRFNFWRRLWPFNR